MCHVHGAVLGDDPVALAHVCRNNRNDTELACAIDLCHRKLPGSRGSYVQHVRGGRIVEIVNTVASVNGRQHLPIPAGVQYLCLGAAGHEEIACVLIDLQAMRPVGPAVGMPLRHRLAGRQIDRGGEVLVLVVHVKAAALGIHGIAFGPAREGQLRFLLQRFAILRTLLSRGDVTQTSLVGAT